MDKIQWIFFDIGSTLVDEREAYAHRVRDMIAGSEVSFAQFWEKRIEFARQGVNGDAGAAAYFHLAKTPWHSEDERPFPDSAGALQNLRERGYRLGVIANQGPGAAERLEQWGLRRFMEVIASSAELGLAKPSAEIFLWAMREAGCTPEEAAMVGDRLDNDILPANRLGMTTVWMKTGLAGWQTPREGLETPDYTIHAPRELTAIFP